MEPQNPIAVAFDNLKIQSVAACIKSLKALEDIIGDKDVEAAVRIKAIHEVIVILDKSVEHLDLQERAKQMREVVDKIAKENPYQPEIG